MAQENSDNGVLAAPPVAVGFTALKPQVVVAAQKADEAVQFYKAAFGAEEVKRSSHPKRKADQETPLILSAELKICGSSFLVSDQINESLPAVGKEGAAAPGIMLRLETDDVQGAVASAVKAGATQEGDLVEEEGGAVLASVKDPFGVVWAIASHAQA